MTDNIIDRIRKLLAMSKDTSSPHEAAIAARRARALMDAHQVSELDLSTVTDDQFGEEVFRTGQKTYNHAIGSLALAMARLNDCVAIGVNAEGGGKGVRFSGLLADVSTAILMLSWLRREMYRQAELHVEGRANRAAFRKGFASGVQQQVKDILAERERDVRMSDGRSLVVAKQALVKQRFGAQRVRTRSATMSGDRSAYDRGRQVGQRTNLSRQVSGNHQRTLPA